LEDFIQKNFENIRQIICQRFRQISDVILFLNEKKTYNNQIVDYELFIKVITSEKLDFDIFANIVKIIRNYEELIKKENIIVFVNGKRYYMNENNIIEDDIMAFISNDVLESPLLMQDNSLKSDKISFQAYAKLPFQDNDCDLDKDFFEDSEGYYIHSPDSPVFDVSEQ